MSAGLDKILDSIKENPDNNNLLSRYVQLATDSISFEGVEAIAKLVDVYLEIYPKKALEIATSLLDYARSEGLEKICEKIAMEKISICFRAMGKNEEADKVSAEIAKLFGEDASATHIMTDEESLKTFAAESSKPESMLKKLPDMDLGLDLGLQDAQIVAPLNVEKTNVNDISEAVSLDLGLSLADAQTEEDKYAETVHTGAFDRTRIEKIDDDVRKRELSEIEIEEKNRANVKIHLPIEEAEDEASLVKESPISNESMLAMNERGLGPNLLTGSDEFTLSEEAAETESVDLKFWREIFSIFDKKELSSEAELARYIEDSHKEVNCVLTDMTRDNISSLLWVAYKEQDYLLTSQFFHDFSFEEVSSFFVAMNKDQSFVDVFEVFLLGLFSSKKYRKINYFLHLYLHFDDSLNWAKFMYKQYRKYWNATSQLGSSWEEKDGVKALFTKLSKRSFPSLSKISV